MDELTVGEKKRQLCVETCRYFEAINSFLHLTACSVANLKLVEAIEYLKVCGRMANLFESKLREKIDGI